MVEIYNEDLRDLLAPLAGKQKKAQVLQIKVCCTVLCGAVLCCTALCCAVLCCAVWRLLASARKLLLVKSFLSLLAIYFLLRGAVLCCAMLC